MTVNQMGRRRALVQRGLRGALLGTTGLVGCVATPAWAGTCNNAAAPYEIPAQGTNVVLDSNCAGDGGLVEVTGDVIQSLNVATIADGAGNEENWKVSVRSGVTVGSGSAFTAIRFRSPGGSVDNSGVVSNTSTGGAIDFIGFAGEVTNRAGGIISADAASTILFYAGGEIDNGGTISNNTGAAINNQAAALDLGNTGTISTTSGLFAITSNAGAVIDNSGTITGGISAFTNGTLDLTNSGIISGGDEGVAVRAINIAAAITNSGTISAGAGSAYAIEFLGTTGADDSLALLPGSTINGNVSAGAGVDTLRFGGGTGSHSFDLGGIGAAAQYQDFETFIVDAGASNWIFGGGTSVDFSVLGGTMSIGAAGAAFGGLTLETGGTVDIDGHVLTVDSLTQNGGIIGGGTITAAAPYRLRGGLFDAAIDDANAVFVEGGGSVTLGNNAALNGGGALAVDGGSTLDLGATGQVAGAFQLTDGLVRNGTLSAASYSLESGEISANLSGAGSLAKLTGGTVILSGANDYTGGTTISAGTLVGDVGSLPGDILNNAALIFDQASAGAHGGAISGTGSLTKDGAGVLTLTGANDYTGGTTISAGSLIGDAGSLQGDIVNNAALIFDQASDGAYGGALSGSGSLTKTGSGALTLSDNSSGFGGSTMVEAGTLAIDGQLGSAAHRLEASGGATLGGAGTIGGLVTVADATLAAGGDAVGKLTIDGALVLGSASSLAYQLGSPSGAAGVDSDLVVVTGDLTLDGTIDVADAGGFGSGLYRLIDYGGALTDNGLDLGTTPAGFPASNLTIQTAIAGEVNLIVAPSSYFMWDGTQTVANGAIEGGDGIWSATGTNWTVADGNFNGPFDPAATLILTGTPGTVTVDASAGAVAIGADLQFAVDGYTVAGDAITLDGTLNTIRVGDGTAADGGFVATIASKLTGAGSLRVNDLGTLVLTGANDYAGVTRIASGTLQLGDGGASGSITGPVLNNGTLAFNRSNDLTFTGRISGTGTIRQIGTGRTDLTGNSAIFAGATLVEAGTLAVNGALGGTIDVLAGGRLQGGGSLGDMIVRGVVAPGGSIGTLSVAGDISFAAGSVYEVEVDAAGQGDLIDVSGAASLDGGAVQVLAGAGNYAPETDYTILTADGGVTGVFAGGVTSNLAFLDPSLSYDANNVYLRLTRNDISFDGIGRTPNQIAAGAGAESLGLHNAVFDAVLDLSTRQARDAFDQLSGEVHASARTAMLEDSRFVRHAIWDRLRSAARGDEGALWGRGLGARGHAGGDGNAARLERSLGGLLMGGDVRVGDNVRIGIAGGYDQASVDVAARNSSGTIDSYHLGAYAGGEWGAAAIRTGVAHSWRDVHTTRTIAFPGYQDRARAGYGARTLQAFGELGYAFDLGRSRVEPYANIAYVRARSEAFAETGGDAALVGAKATSDVTFSTLGARGSAMFDLGGAQATLRGGAGWRHAFGDTVPLTRMRYLAGGDGFLIAGLPVARDAAAFDAAVDVALSGKASIGVSYRGFTGDGFTDHTAGATFVVKF